MLYGEKTPRERQKETCHGEQLQEGMGEQLQEGRMSDFAGQMHFTHPELLHCVAVHPFP